MTNVLSLHALICGTRFTVRRDGEATTAGAQWTDEGTHRAVPITAFLIRTVNGNVLVDTGLDPRHLAGSTRRAVMFADRGWNPPPVVDEGHDLAARLKACGLELGDIDRIVLSHLHADHTGGLKRMPQAEVLLQRAEHTAAFAPGGPFDPFYFPADYDVPGIAFQLAEGDMVIDEGLITVATPGHTAGHQSLIVELPERGPVVLAGAAADLREDLACARVPDTHVDADAALASLRRINELSWSLGAEVFVGGDPLQAEAHRRAADGYH